AGPVPGSRAVFVVLDEPPDRAGVPAADDPVPSAAFLPAAAPCAAADSCSPLRRAACSLPSVSRSPWDCARLSARSSPAAAGRGAAAPATAGGGRRASGRRRVGGRARAVGGGRGWGAGGGGGAGGALRGRRWWAETRGRRANAAGGGAVVGRLRVERRADCV